MLTPSQLSGSHRRCYDAIFRHPLTHTLPWREVHQLFREIALVEEQPNGNFRITRNGEIMVLKPATTKDLSDASELMAVRHFLEKSEPKQPASESATGETHCVVTIDHRLARIFRSASGGAAPTEISPPAPEDYFRHAHNSQEFSRGKEKPELNSYFEPIARELTSGSAGKIPAKILLLGNGKGMASEMEQFKSWLEHHHPDLFKRVIGALAIDEHHLSDNQLLAKARDFFATHAATPVPTA